MPSSIFSSDAATAYQRAPALASIKVFTITLLILFASVGVMELRLAAKGFEPAVTDSPELWAKQRQRLQALGDEGLALVGASRIMLGVDLETLGNLTDYEPVQLGIDGSGAFPVLEHLALDESFRGHVLVDYQANLFSGMRHGGGPRYIKHYNEQQQQWPLTSAVSEARLSDSLQSKLRSYANGTRPITALLLRVLDANAGPQYLIMRHNREVLADYSLVKMPDFYFARVMRHANLKIKEGSIKTYADWQNSLQLQINALKEVDNTEFVEGISHINHLVDRLHARGSKVWFVRLPTSGMVQEADNRRRPREKFWNLFAERTQAKTIHYQDHPLLSSFTCPDGSHLDRSDRTMFTQGLAQLINAE